MDLGPIVNENPNILLVHPSSGGKAALAATRATSEHLGLAYLASAVKNTPASASILDLENTPFTSAEFGSFISRGDFDLIGFSPTSKSSGNTIDLMKAVKKENPEIITVWGGHLASGIGKRIFDLTPDLDAIVVGDGISPMELIANALCHGRQLPIHPAIKINPRSNVRAVSVNLPSSANGWADLLPVRYLDKAAYRNRGARIVTSLGCPYDCSFCTTPFFYSRKVTKRTVESVLGEVQTLVQLGVDRLWINDDLFVDGSAKGKKWALDFASALHLRHPSVKFRALFRADSFKNDPDLMKSLSRDGLDIIFCGIESGDAEILRSLNKRIQLNDSVAIADLAHQYGVSFQPGFIMFTQTSTLRSMRSNVDFLFQMGQLYRIFPATRTSVAFPGTKLWKDLHENEMVDPDRSNDFIAYPKFMSPEIRDLSIAFEILEEKFATLDSTMLGLYQEGRLPPSAKHRLCSLIRSKLLATLDYALEKPGPSSLIRYFDGFDAALESLIAPHLKASTQRGQ